MGVATEPALEGGQGFLAKQIRESGGERRESDGEAGSQGGLRKVLRDHRLAKAAATLEQDVLAAVDELELDEALDERAIDLLGVRPVEAVEGLERAEARGPSPSSKVDRDAGSLLEIGELFERLRGAEAALVHVGEKRRE